MCEKILLCGGILHTTLLSDRVVIKISFVCFLMPALHHYSPGITLSIPNCLRVLNLTAPCLWLVNSESFRMLPFCTNAVSGTQYSLNTLAAVFSVYFPVQLHESLLCRLILVFFLFLLFSVFIFSFLRFLRGDLVYHIDLPVQGKAVLLPLKGGVQHHTLDLHKSRNSDACLGSPSKN